MPGAGLGGGEGEPHVIVEASAKCPPNPGWPHGHNVSRVSIIQRQWPLIRCEASDAASLASDHMSTSQESWKLSCSFYSCYICD